MFWKTKKKERLQIVLVDCIAGTYHEITRSPFSIEKENLLGGEKNIYPLQILTNENGTFSICKMEEIGILVNAQSIGSVYVFDKTITLQIDKALYVLIVSQHAVMEASRLDFSKWTIFNVESGYIEDEVPFPRIRNSIARRGLTGAGLAVCPKHCPVGFFYSQLFNEEDIGDVATPSEDSEYNVTCPLCWLKFDIGDAMSIASHESLRGDPVLGSEEMLRFLPTSFGMDGVPLDAAGLPSPDVACPHCRKKMPPNFLNMNRHIMSIVGAPSAGKSYYLCILIRELQNALFKYYGISLKDLDPTGNMLLTQMKNKLFSADKPEEAILAKTALEGAMYERYPRNGKIVALPKPITYGMKGKTDKDSALVFYDNAGEHFEPGLDMDDSPGAMHVASSSAIFFLFDPAANTNFKKLLTNVEDPQLKIRGRLDQQDTILAEMEVRIKRILGLDSYQKIEIPVAVIIGKFDIWKSLLKCELKPYYLNGKISQENIDYNSDVVRSLMMSIDPSIVMNSEAISTNVKYFPISPLGHSPIKITEGDCEGKIAPIPSQINPINVEIPTMWVLSQISKILK